MPESGYVVSLRVYSLSAPEDERLITGNFDLSAPRPLSDVEIRTHAVNYLAKAAGVPASSLEVDHLIYTALPAI